jgi:uncharacterized OB-fold protein
MDVSQSFALSESGEIVLHGTRCPQCGHASFPGRLTCPACHIRAVQPAGLAGSGRIRTWTKVEIPPAGFTDPIVVADVVLDDGPTLFTLLTGEPNGERVRAMPHPVRDGAPGYAFEAAR